jgi:tRNA threonylcarbamoyladenosine modification (KEOPS) complex Cgi121 subunit
MLKQLEEYCKYVEITGYRNVKIKDAKELLNAVRGEAQLDSEVQFFDADLVASWQHLYFAVLNALMALSSSRNISKSLAVEIMLYASAQRQIKKAIKLIGVKGCSENVAVVIVNANADLVKTGVCAVTKYLNLKPDASVLELSKEKTQRIKCVFGISDVELETVTAKKNAEQALVDSVIERVALLSTQL